MTITQNAGGGDWFDLPTRPVQHRGNRKPEGLPWTELTEQYVARGGQVDAGVWHKGKVQVVEGGGRGKDRVHSYAIDGEYDDTNTLANAVPAKVRNTTRVLDDAQQKQVCLRYRRGATLQECADAFGVSTTAIQTALRNNNEPVRPRGGSHGRRAAS
ncbi:hypothetical protein ACFPJ1_40530 [Kribbella qitaiheensis]|uniref:hypothetical protein n=1 Tax=Kribbella qitaiheensis TaxID=1544730 RepID=UPI00360D6800